MHDAKILLIAGAAAGPWVDVPADAPSVIVTYANLTLTLLKNILPDVIVLPLFGTGFDAMDAIARLSGMGYAGRIIVTGPALPRPTLIARELTSMASGMTITLIGPQVNGQVGLPPDMAPESR